MLLKSPRPVQIVTGYLVERLRTLSKQITDRPTNHPFLSVCRVVALCWQCAARSENPQLSYAELSHTIKDILLLSQIEIDDIFERLKKLNLVSIAEVKGTFSRKDPLLGSSKPGTAFVKDRVVRLPDADQFMADTVTPPGFNGNDDNQLNPAKGTDRIDAYDAAATSRISYRHAGRSNVLTLGGNVVSSKRLNPSGGDGSDTVKNVSVF